MKSRFGFLFLVLLVLVPVLGFPIMAYAQEATKSAPIFDLNAFLSDLLKMVLAVAVPALMLFFQKLLKVVLDALVAVADSFHLGNVAKEAETAVISLYEKTAKGIQADFADGKITEEEKKARLVQVKKDAVEMLEGYVKTLPSRLQPYLSSKLGEVIESALGKLKLSGIMPQSTKTSQPLPSDPTQSPVSK